MVSSFQQPLYYVTPMPGTGLYRLTEALELENQIGRFAVNRLLGTAGEAGNR